MRKQSVVLLVAILLAAGTAVAQVDTGHPGYFPIEQMGVLAKGDLEVDIDLTGAMLQVAAGAMQEDEGDDADLAKLVSGLERVRVQVGEPKGSDGSAIGLAFEQAVAGMEGKGWSRILRVIDGEEQIHLFSREVGGTIVGLTVLMNDDNEEIVLVNIVGDIDPVALGKVLAGADTLPDLKQFVAAGDR